MNCPQCNRTVSQQQMPDGTLVFHCEKCGWGRQRLEAALAGGSGEPAPSAPSPARTAMTLTFWWIVSFIIVLGPYLLLRFGVPALLVDEGQLAADAGQKLAGVLDRHYWWIIGLYLLISFSVSPQPMSDYYGMFGMPTINNPFTYEDNYNRTMVGLAIVLMPGKVVWQTTTQTFLALKRLVRGGAA
ncbi:MAG: hypothetical protein ACODAQ_05380 [Phycisphaeraceae bacterium]